MLRRVAFEKRFKPEDLVNGVEFEINQDENFSDGSDEFDDERFDEYKFEIDKMQASEFHLPFDELKQIMIPLTGDGCVHKQVLKWGTGIVVPEKAVVIIHYDAFLENQRMPFDSTRLRNRPHKFLIGDGNIILGLDLSIQTMKKGELSRFLVAPDYAYGEMGCPPRIPGNAYIMYVVEILHFFESKDAVEFEEMTADEQKKAPFGKVVAVLHCEHQLANDMFRKKHFKPAIARYRKMVKILEDVSVANEEEDKKRNDYLIKLYLNLCLSYTNIMNSQKAIVYGKLGLKLNESNPKAMYRLACAYLLADEFDNAKQYLLKAKKYKPFESCVNTALIDLERKRKQHKDWENVFYKRMFFSHNAEPKVTSESPEIKEFRDVLQKQFKKFIDSDEEEFAFSSGYTDWQVDVVKELAHAHSLAFVSKIYYGKKIIKVFKH